MSLTADMSADFLSVWEELQTRVDLLYQPQVRALVSEDALSADLSIGGYDDRRSLTVKMLREEVTSVVKVGDPVQYGGVTYRIEKIRERRPLPFLILECREK